MIYDFKMSYILINNDYYVIREWVGYKTIRCKIIGNKEVEVI